MAYIPTDTDLADLKASLEITGTDKDALLNLLIKLTGTKALNNMNQTVMPDDFQPVLIEMTHDVYRLREAEKGEQVQTVSSVSDNGQSVSYKDSSFDKALQQVVSVLKDYEGQLVRFRKARW